VTCLQHTEQSSSDPASQSLPVHLPRATKVQQTAVTQLGDIKPVRHPYNVQLSRSNSEDNNKKLLELSRVDTNSKQTRADNLSDNAVTLTKQSYFLSGQKSHKTAIKDKVVIKSSQFFH